MTKTDNKTEEYLNEMYASVERMNAHYLTGDFIKVEEEKDLQKKAKKKFFEFKEYE